MRVEACNLLVTMLAHDAPMQYVYDKDSEFFVNTFIGNNIYGGFFS